MTTGVVSGNYPSATTFYCNNKIIDQLINLSLHMCEEDANTCAHSNNKIKRIYNFILFHFRYYQARSKNCVSGSNVLGIVINTGGRLLCNEEHHRCEKF